MGFLNQLLKLLGLKKGSGEGSASTEEKGGADAGTPEDAGDGNQENTGV